MDETMAGERAEMAGEAEEEGGEGGEEQAERSTILPQEEPEPPHIKEEPEEKLQRPEEPGGSTSTSAAVKSAEGDEDVFSHCSEAEDELGSDFEITEDIDDWEETSGGQSYDVKCTFFFYPFSCFLILIAPISIW